MVLGKTKSTSTEMKGKTTCVRFLTKSNMTESAIFKIQYFNLVGLIKFHTVIENTKVFPIMVVL